MIISSTTKEPYLIKLNFCFCMFCFYLVSTENLLWGTVSQTSKQVIAKQRYPHIH